MEQGPTETQMDSDSGNEEELDVDTVIPDPNKAEELDVGTELEVDAAPGPTEAETEAKKGDVPDLSAPAPPTVAPAITGISKEEALERYRALHCYFETLRVDKEALEVRMTEVQKAMAQVYPYLEEKPDPKAGQMAIIQYIESQRDLRRAKMLRRNEVLQGLKIHDILPVKGSKLDESMARKRGFGTQRPSYPSTQ